LPHRPGPGRRQDGEPVQRPLRPQLLHDADERVRYENDAEQGVLDRSDDQDHHEQRAEQRVEGSEDIRSDDLRQRSAGGLGNVVRLASAGPLEDLGVCEPREDGFRLGASAPSIEVGNARHPLGCRSVRENQRYTNKYTTPTKTAPPTMLPRVAERMLAAALPTARG